VLEVDHVGVELLADHARLESVTLPAVVAGFDDFGIAGRVARIGCGHRRRVGVIVTAAGPSEVIGPAIMTMAATIPSGRDQGLMRALLRRASSSQSHTSRTAP
jgi:hypothetical protein